MGKFKYQGSDSSVVDKYASGGSDFDRYFTDGVKMYKPPEGKNRIRILPKGWDDEQGPRHWSFPVWIHFGVGPDNGSYICNAKQGVGDGQCAVCEQRSKMQLDGNEKAAKELRPSMQHMAYIIDRNNEEDGPIIFRIPGKLHKNICQLSRDDDGGAGGLLQIDHPDEGFDVTFVRTGTGLHTEYSAVQIARNESPISQDEDEQDDWLMHVVDNSIPSILNTYDHDYVQRILGGTSSTKPSEDAGSDDFEHDEVDFRESRSRRRSKEEVTDDPEDSIEDPDESLDDDTEEDAPLPRRRRRRKQTA